MFYKKLSIHSTATTISFIKTMDYETLVLVFGENKSDFFFWLRKLFMLLKFMFMLRSKIFTWVRSGPENFLISNVQVQCAANQQIHIIFESEKDKWVFKNVVCSTHSQMCKYLWHFNRNKRQFRFLSEKIWYNHLSVISNL